jgi:hypothetical protein
LSTSELVMRSAAKRLAVAINEHIVALRAEIEELKQRVVAAEAGKTWNYIGVWRGGQADAGTVATHDGATWLATRATALKPSGPDSGWVLIAKRGERGMSAYECARSHGYRGSETEWLASLKGHATDNAIRPSGGA